MFDQNQSNFQPQQTAGYQYQGYQQQPKIMNNLTTEQIQQLQQQRTTFSLGLTERERLQAGCNHRSPDGTSDSLKYDPATGIAQCTICGYEFRPIDPDESPEDIQAAVDKIVDIIQTIKIMYPDIPGSAAMEYYQILPLIMKVPELFKFAAKNFDKYEQNNWNYNNRSMGAIAMLNNMQSMFGMGGMNPGFVQQPMYQAQPNMAPNMAQGFPQGAYGAPQPMGPSNGFGYNAPMGGQQYQPQTQGYQYQPNQTAQAPVQPQVTAPAAPATEGAKEETTVTQAVNV